MKFFFSGKCKVSDEQIHSAPQRRWNTKEQNGAGNEKFSRCLSGVRANVFKYVQRRHSPAFCSTFYVQFLLFCTQDKHYNTSASVCASKKIVPSLFFFVLNF